MKRIAPAEQEKDSMNLREGFVPKPHFFRGAAGTLLLIHSLLSVLLQILWISMPDGFAGISKNGLNGYVLAGILMQSACILVPTLFVLFWFEIPIGPPIGISKTTPGGVLMSITIGIPAAVVFIGLNNGFLYFISQLGIVLPASSLPTWTAYQGPRSLALVIIVSVLLPGIIEELMFRGIIQGSIESEGGRFSAVFIQAFAFAVFHVDPLFLFAPFLAGMLLGFVRKRTGSLYSSILTHMSLNLTILLMQPLLPRITSEYFTATPPSLQTLYSSLAAAAIAAVALIPMILAFPSKPKEAPRVRDKILRLPVDWKFILGCLVLTSTLLYNYFSHSA